MEALVRRPSQNLDVHSSVISQDRVDKLKTKRWGTGCSGSEAGDSEGIEAEVERLEVSVVTRHRSPSQLLG